MAISGSNDISLLQMGIGLLPVGIALFLSWKYKLCLSKPLIIGVVRGTVQLVAVGYILLCFPTVGSLDTGCANSIHDGCSITSSFKTAWRTSE